MIIIASSKWNLGISLNIAQISSSHVEKFRLGLSEFSDVYMIETPCPILTVK